MFFELREYYTKPGQRDNWRKFMEEKIIPFQTSKGMNILGTFVGQDDDNLYVWIRRFNSEDEYRRLYKDVYESEFWQKDIAPKIPDMLDSDRYSIKRIVATKSLGSNCFE